MEKILKKILAAICIVLLVGLLPSCGAAEKAMDVLPALKQAGLQGKLIFIMYRQAGNQLIELNLATGASRVLFDAPNQSWLGSAAVSPDGKSILLAYAPPPPKGQVQLANTSLFRIARDGSGAPQPLLQPTQANESFAYPAWAPDGQSVYFTHSAPTASRLGVETNIERFQPGEHLGAKPEIVVRTATSPSLSPDGARLAYLGLSEFTSQNSLYLAKTDGASPTELVPASQYPIVDAPIFSPDGKQVYFTAPSTAADTGSGASPRSDWLDRWFGVTRVTAHAIPSDWYRVSADGGQPQRVTQVKDVGMVAAFSPDGQRLAFASQKGLFVMQPDGSQLTQIADLVGMGSIAWVK